MRGSRSAIRTDKIPGSLKNLETRIAVADSFFNRHTIHRIGIEASRRWLLSSASATSSP